MQGDRRLTTSMTLFLGASAVALACGSGKKDDPGGLTSKARPSGGSAGMAASNGMGTGGVGGTTGGSASGGDGGTLIVTGGTAGSGTSGSGGTDVACGSDEFDALQVPLDLYVMLDSSGSMLDDAGSATKWDAIRGALSTFISDPASSGIGIGLQFFPQRDPTVPETCDADADCGTHGPCLQKFCKDAGPDIYFCGNDDECKDATGEDFGPCAPVTFCWSLATRNVDPFIQLCHNDLDCPGDDGDCVGFNECSGNTEIGCKEPGTTCIFEGENIGTCRRFDPTSTCGNETDCRPATYAAPAAEVATLPDAANALNDVILAKDPEGNTPSAPALSGAIAHGRTWASAHPDHKVAVLFATDGLPTECIDDPTLDPSGVNEVAAAAAAGLSGSPSVPTFVIGVFSPEDTAQGAATNLDQIARSGGSEQAFIVETNGNVEAEFLAALDVIRGSRLPCEYQIPESTSGATDYDKVNVVFTEGGDKHSLYYWKDEDACDPDSGGWHYDVDPKSGETPTTIIACPASCAAFQAATNGHVSIALGCDTVVK